MIFFRKAVFISEHSHRGPRNTPLSIDSDQTSMQPCLFLCQSLDHLLDIDEGSQIRQCYAHVMLMLLVPEDGGASGSIVDVASGS
jgi:hypothetical protein